jgi:hypothetical protein
MQRGRKCEKSLLVLLDYLLKAFYARNRRVCSFFERTVFFGEYQFVRFGCHINASGLLVFGALKRTTPAGAITR